MIKKLWCKLTSLLLVLLCLFGQATAQFQEGVELNTVLSKTDAINVHTGVTNILPDNTGGSPATILNIVTLKIKELNTPVNIYFKSNFTATVSADVEGTDLDGTVVTLPSISLVVKYDIAQGAQYKILDFKTYKNYKLLKLTFTGDVVITDAQPGWNPKDVVEVVNEMRTTVYNDLSNNLTDLQPNYFTSTPYKPTEDVLRVVWKYPAQAHENMTQLEWSFVEDEMISYYNNDHQALFQNNSTRVDLQYNEKGKDHILGHENFYTYDIPFLFPLKGKLFYRTRAVQRKGNGTLITGEWSTVDIINNIGNFPVVVGHDTLLNWQSSTSFAEGGKYKTVIQYFDGSLRGRQTVTKDNSTGNTVVGETIYDLQGRPNIQILPTPTADNTIKFFGGFNKFNGMATNEDPAKYFDLTPAAIKCGAAPQLDTTAGNGLYYSGSNYWLNAANPEAKAKYIPNAQGFAFTETRFMNDATERVAAQGGVGADHQIGSGHETKYYYGKPSQPELDALFGTEVGDADHYSKNMVQDANGQRSVSYVDMHGRTVATALAGDATAGIDSIYNQVDYPLLEGAGVIRNNLLTPTSNVIQDNSIVSVNTFLAAATTTCDFVYELTPAILQLTSCTNQPICFDCKYNLEISIRSEECNPRAPKIFKYNNLQLVQANQACNTPMGFTGTGFNAPVTQITFKDTLAPGSYVITKTLTINDSMFQVRRDSALKVLLCTSKDSLIRTIRDSLIQITGCGANPSQTCASCVAELGTFPFYMQKYLSSISPATATEAYIREQYVIDSLDCAKTCSISDTCAENINPQLATLLTLRNQMLADMKPFTGQYATDTITSNLVGNLYVPDYGSIDAKYNIFGNEYTGTFIATPLRPKPYFKKPTGESFLPQDNFYFDSNHLVDSTIHGSTFNSLLPNEKILDTLNINNNYPFSPSNNFFSNLFQDTWANSLIIYHPEYTKLKFAETTMRSSYEWADRVSATSCYQRALDSNFVNPLISDPYFALPNTQADKDSLTHYLYTGISYNTSVTSPSIWQIANSTVACVAVDSLAKYACMMRDQHNEKLGLSTLITGNANKNEVWAQFKTLYFSYRDEMVLRYIQNQPGVIPRAEINQLLAEGKDLVFANNQDVATQNGAGVLWAGITNPNNTDTTGLGVYVAANSLNNCEGQRPFWKARLKNCEALQTLLNHNTTDSTNAIRIIDLILDSMVMVCKSSVNGQQPYGSSTVSPTSTAYPSSFESIINNVLTANGIVTQTTNYFCNPYTIEFPKPFGLNPTLFVNTSNVLDTCACNRFAKLKIEATSAGYNPLSFVSMNQFLNAVYKDSLTLVVWNGLQQCGNTINNCCRNPIINTTQKILQNGTAGIKLYYSLPTKCDTCKILVYSQANVLLNTINGICGTNNYFINLDTCTSYKFVIKCENISCGILVSDTALYAGCQLTGICPTPSIISVLNGESKGQQYISVNFVVPQNCSSCNVKMYVGNTVVQTINNTCDNAYAIFSVPDTCTSYQFKVSCTDVICGTKTSPFSSSAGCGVSSTNNQPSFVNVNVTNILNRCNPPCPTITDSCAVCVLNVYDRVQYGQPAQYKAKCEIIFWPGFESIANDNFEAFITPNAPLCDTSGCTKPAITNVVSSGVNHSFIVFYTLTPGCDSCKISMYNASGSLVGYNGNICGTSSYTFTNASYDSCTQYSFVVTCYKAACFSGTGNSSIIYNYTGCNNQPADTCYKQQPIYLSGYAVIPAFLSCGYVKPCISCEKVDQLTAEFTAIYPSYAGVPFLEDNSTQQHTDINNLWARFINYRVGFSKKTIDYARAYRNCYPVGGPAPAPTSYALCALDPPLNSPILDSVPPQNPCEQAETQAIFMADLQFNSIKDSLIANFDSLYKAKCLSAQSMEKFYMDYRPNEYHYTLYYYDQAGNLVKTIPPAAVKPNYDATYLTSVETARASNTDNANPKNNEVMATQYRYNSLNQVVEQKTPDAGVSKFWYDKLGRLVVSQNAQQQTTNKYSYTQYDELGRITTVGEKPQTQLMSQATSQNETDLATWLADVSNGGSLKKQITRTVYDVGYFNANQPTLLQPVLTQKNLRNRVSYTQLINDEPADFATNEFAYVGAHAAATYYSYDIHGNVDTLVQDNNTGYMKYKNPFETDATALESQANLSGNRFKKMVYDYDLISGKVNKVSYQPSMTDQFYHRYKYDAENRITSIVTSHDSIYWEEDATYAYYRHGPLSRMVLGKNEVQGVDYAYTIQGWLKGVNSTATLPTTGAAVTSSFDMGNDGVGSSLTARDAYGYSLNYFNGDYKPIGVSLMPNTPAFVQPFVSITNSLPDAADGVQLGTDLFNGNIRAMMVNIPSLATAGGGGGILYGYRYDQLNRIKAMNSFVGFNNATNDFGANNMLPTVSENYKERVTYDPNGNIKTYLRNGTDVGGTQQVMDNLTYQYEKQATGAYAGQFASNKLRYVHDQVNAGNYSEDIDSQTPLNLTGAAGTPSVVTDVNTAQATDNYAYDKIGNLIKDEKEGITNIVWTVYGKISAITKTKLGVTTLINYTYDASGNRLSKMVKVGGAAPLVTYYVRDASGNVMSLYGRVAPVGNTAVELTQTEVSMYGSSRLGIWNINRSVANISAIDYNAYSSNLMRGNKFFELSNHLGNVLVTISDKKIGIASTTDPNLIAYYNADVVTANDYYPGGMTMPGRSYFSTSQYRYGFNGQEKSTEIANGLTTAEFWEYDSRIGRRWNVDPVLKEFESPYLSFSGNPILFSDPNGDDAGQTEDPPKKGSKQTQHIKGAQDGIAPNGDLILMGKKNTGVHIISTNLGTDKKADFRVTYFFVEGENGGWSWNNEKRAFTRGNEEFSNGGATAIFNKVGMGTGTNLSEAATNIINGEPLKDTRQAYSQYKQNGGGGAVPGFILNGVTTSLGNWADDMQAGGNRSRDAWIGLWQFSSDMAKGSMLSSSKGLSVIGPRATYRQFAKKIGASFLDVTDAEWTMRKNVSFLQSVVMRGDDVMFAGKYNPLKLDPKSILAQEIRYLQRHGYSWTSGFSKMVKK